MSKFSAKKSYNWSPDSIMGFSGVEFEFMFHKMLELMSTPYGIQHSMSTVAVFKMMENKFNEFLDSGIIKEVEENSIKEIKDVDIETEG